MKHWKVHFKSPKSVGWVVIDADSDLGASCMLWKKVKNATITKVYEVEKGY